MVRSKGELERVGGWIVNQLLAHAGVEERKSRFAEREALFFRGAEIFHLEEPGLADVRLGRRTIRSRKEEFSSDPRIELRPNSSEWVQIRFARREDAALVVQLVESAIRAAE